MATMIPLLAAPAGAVVNTECKSNQFPNRFGSQSKLTVDCTSPGGTTTNNIQIHDADNAIWHHGAGRAVTLGISPYNTATTRAVTAGSATVHIVSGVITSADIRRPISAVLGTKSILPGGAFIKAVSGTTVTLSQALPTTINGGTTSTTAITGKIDYTNNRWLVDATCTNAIATINTLAPGFATTDVGKSVSGGPWPAGTFISAVASNGALSATTNQGPVGNCTTDNGTTAGKDKIEIGAATYSGGNPVWSSDPMNLQLSNTSVGGAGFTCTSGKIGMTATSFAQTGGFVTADAGLTVQIKTTVGSVTTTAPAGKITGVTLTGNTSATLSPTTACPTLAAADSTHSQFAVVGAPNSGAPKNGSAMMSLGAELNLNPGLVPTQDDCSANTLDGFMVVGGWTSPGGYAASAATPPASVGQILFPTAVISFNGWIVPRKGGETVGTYSDPNPHYTFTFPLLPTSLAECLSGGAPLSPTGLEFTMNPTVLSTTPFLPTGSGDLGDPSVRSLMPETGAFDITVQQINNTGPVENSKSTTTCTVVVATADPLLGSGGGCV